MDFWKSAGGMMEAELTSAEPGAALAAINERNIPLFHVRQEGDLTVAFLVRRRDYRQLSALCEKRGETLRLCRRLGIYWTGSRLLHRPLLLAGLILFLTAALYLPTRIFFVRVEGNTAVPTRLILEAAGESGIRFGASRREVRSEKMKNALLSKVPELQWAGVNTAGCVATISVRERTDPKLTQQDSAVSSIVASRDGFVLSATVTRGTALCRVGEAVKAGQVLISGYTDCGICIQATRAEGEIYAQTSRTLTAVTPSQWVFRGEPTDVRKKYSLLLGKKRINLWKDSGNFRGSCGRMDTQYILTLPGGFSLPVALCVETYQFYEPSPGETEAEAAKTALSGFARRYLSRQMIAGSILDPEESFTADHGLYRLEGNYVCTEMIGRVRAEQIGDTNGKSG
ncbi:MAG: sporulation protein YqfD [Firmicutes bacterium]|nr:sporulation protein YqfD [Bacillota bacterium]